MADRYASHTGFSWLKLLVILAFSALVTAGCKTTVTMPGGVSVPTGGMPSPSGGTPAPPGGGMPTPGGGMPSPPSPPGGESGGGGGLARGKSRKVGGLVGLHRGLDSVMDF